jgi:hypothetical protein
VTRRLGFSPSCVLAGDDACCLVNKTHCRSLELRSNKRVQLRHVRAEPEEPETNAGGDDHGANQSGRGGGENMS